MNPKGKSIKLFVIAFVLFLLFGIVGSVLLRNYNEEKYPERFIDTVESLDETYDKSFPQIINEPPRGSFVGEVYDFTPRVAPADNVTNLTLLDGPEWLVMEGAVLTGVPSDVGTENFTLRVEKDGRHVDWEFFLVVSEGINE